MPRATVGKGYCNECDAICPIGHQCPANDISTLYLEVAQVALLDQATSDLGGVLPDEGHVSDETGQQMFAHLVDLDLEVHRRLQIIADVLDQWSATGNATMPSKSLSPGDTVGDAWVRLQDQRAWMSDTIMRVANIKLNNDSANLLYADGVVSNCKGAIKRINKRLECWGAIPEPDNSYNTDRYANHPLRDTSVADGIVLYLAVVLNLLFHVSQDACAVVLQIVSLLLKGFQNEPTSIPSDIRSALKRINMDPIKLYMAVCPHCHDVEEPTYDEKGNACYPATCGSCDKRLTKWVIGPDRVAVRRPIRPYVMQCFTDFCARLYTRPGIETAIIRYRDYLKGKRTPWIHDINQAAGIRNFLDSTGQVFVDSEDEIRTVWSISYDSYNLLHNKIAGKSASAGALGMACLSLPPSLRTRPENLYLAGLIPGPQQPTLHRLNPFLRPLTKVLKKSYETGTWYTRTANHPGGRRSREAIIPSVNDLPGGNKLAGHASHSAIVFCSKCHIKKGEINNIDLNSPGYRPITGEEYRKRATAWLDADKSKRQSLLKQYGIRYSELLMLEYWNPVENVVIDGMHTLFLGIVRHHFRVVIGTHWQVKDDDEQRDAGKVNELHVRKARISLNNGTATQSSLKKFSIAVLDRICQDIDVHPKFKKGKGKSTKKPYVLALMGSVHKASKDRREQERDRGVFIPLLEDLTTELGEADVPLLDTDDLLRIQHDIKNTLRPRTQGAPPVNFGSPSHGKLKADQWRTCIEFDLPVSLVRLWVFEPRRKVDQALKQRRDKILKATFDLSMAIRWAISTRTSQEHADRYLGYMLAYLAALRELHPAHDLHPIHHNALHIPFFLLRFGPMRGWWMFFFERLIGSLQKISINYKHGQMEETVLTTFCVASELRNSAHRPGCPPILKQCAEIVEARLPSSNMANEKFDQSEPVSGKTQGVPVQVSRKRTLLAADIAAKFFGPTSNAEVLDLQSYSFGDRKFSPSRISQAQSIVWAPLGPDHEGAPGIIRQIFDHEGKTHLVIHKYRHRIPSYFDSFPDFGASVWTSDTDSVPQIIETGPLIYSANQRPWAEGEVIIRPLIEDF